MISCVERASLHFCSDAAAARVANARMQSSGTSHRLCEAYCQRPAGRSFPDAHVAFHDVFFRGEPSARCGGSGRVVGASRRPVRSWDAPRRLSCPAEACSRWPTRWCGALFLACIMHARTPDAVLGGEGFCPAPTRFRHRRRRGRCRCRSERRDFAQRRHRRHRHGDPPTLGLSRVTCLLRWLRPAVTAKMRHHQRLQGHALRRCSAGVERDCRRSGL